MMTRKPSISIFFPFLNDWGTVGSLVGLAIATVEKLTDDWEVIIVNDGSSTGNREALQLIVDTINSKSKVKSQKSKVQVKSQNYQEAIKIPRMVVKSDLSFLDVKGTGSNKRIRIIDHDKNRGYGGALRSGFATASKELIFYTDCDAQYDPRELTLLYNVMESGIAMVNGYKIKRNDPWFRIIAGRVYHYLVKFAFQLPIRDTDCDFRLIRKSVFNPSTSFDFAQDKSFHSDDASSERAGRGKVKLFENTGTICIELVKKIDYHGFRIVEVPVHHFWRTSGKSQFFNFERLGKTAINLFRLWWKLIVKKEYYS